MNFLKNQYRILAVCVVIAAGIFYAGCSFKSNGKSSSASAVSSAAVQSRAAESGQDNQAYPDWLVKYISSYSGKDKFDEQIKSYVKGIGEIANGKEPGYGYFGNYVYLKKAGKIFINVNTGDAEDYPLYLIDVKTLEQTKNFGILKSQNPRLIGQSVVSDSGEKLLYYYDYTGDDFYKPDDITLKKVNANNGIYVYDINGDGTLNFDKRVELPINVETDFEYKNKDLTRMREIDCTLKSCAGNQIQIEYVFESDHIVQENRHTEHYTLDLSSWELSKDTLEQGGQVVSAASS